MREININVHVQIGVTDGLCALLSAFADNGKRQHGFGERLAEPQPEAQAPTPAKQPEPKPEAEVATAEPQPEAQAPATPAEEPAQAEQPAAPAGPTQEPAKELTEVDVRARMDRTRRRIEGEDYKENTSGEGYKKYHRQLTGLFKQIAALHGADKPSALPDSASRAAFIAECDELVIKDGEIITPVPF